MTYHRLLDQGSAPTSNCQCESMYSSELSPLFHLPWLACGAMLKRYEIDEKMGEWYGYRQYGCIAYVNTVSRGGVWS